MFERWKIRSMRRGNEEKQAYCGRGVILAMGHFW
jgi:hypothetical protein